MSTLKEIRAAIAELDPRGRAILAAELFAMAPEPEEENLGAALERGLHDVKAGRVRPIEDANGLTRKWASIRDGLALAKARELNRNQPTTTINALRRKRGLPEL